jgi:hypothetical protein
MVPIRIISLTMLAGAVIVSDAIMSQVTASVGCEIRSNRTGAGSRLDAVISAEGPVAGTYIFTVKRGGENSPTTESGEFSLESTGRSEVKKASIALAAGESYSASLTINWSGGSSSCSASGS